MGGDAKITEGFMVSFDLKMLGIVLALAVAVIFGYRDLKDDIEEAKKLPEPGTGHYQIDLQDPNARQTWPPTKIEYTMKDQSSRDAIKELQDRVAELEAKVKDLEEE